MDEPDALKSLEHMERTILRCYCITEQGAGVICASRIECLLLLNYLTRTLLVVSEVGAVTAVSDRSLFQGMKRFLNSYLTRAWNKWRELYLSGGQPC